MEKFILVYCIILSWTTHILPVWPFKSPEEKVCRSIMSSNFKEFRKKYPSLIASKNYTELQKANMRELAAKRVAYWDTEHTRLSAKHTAAINLEKIGTGAMYIIGGVAIMVCLSNMADRISNETIIANSLSIDAFKVGPNIYQAALLASAYVPAKFVLDGIRKMYHGMEYGTYLENKKSNAVQIRNYFEDEK